jgi:hypothetical protein
MQIPQIEKVNPQIQEIADERVITLLDKMGRAIAMLYNRLPLNVSFPKIQQVSGNVSIKELPPIKVDNKEIIHHLKVIEGRLGDLTTAISMIDSRKNSIKKGGDKYGKNE